MRNHWLPLLIFGIAGCTKPSSDSTQGPANPQAVTPPNESVATSRPPAPELPHASTTASSSMPAAKLALDGEGLRIFTVPAGTSRSVPFGLGQAETLAMLTAVQGAPDRRLENLECNASSAIWLNGLTTWFAGNKFVGWSVRSPAPALATAGGLRVGATRAEVESGASVARIAESSLGEEFTAGGIGGLLESKGAHAHVTNLWAGDTCIAR